MDHTNTYNSMVPQMDRTNISTENDVCTGPAQIEYRRPQPLPKPITASPQL